MCREISAEELFKATSGFSKAISSDQGGTIYQGRLEGAAVLVYVPTISRLPWSALQNASMLSGASSERIAPMRAICRDGSVVIDSNKASASPP